METNNTYIKLFRKINDWEWYLDIPVKVLFIHLLTKVNFTEKKWQGRDIKKWEIITSLDRLSKETGLTVMQVRTALTKLKSTGEVTSHSTSNFTHIQLQKWEQYQTNVTSEVTNQQQTNNKPITTTKEWKERKEGKETNTRDFFEEELKRVNDTNLSNSLREWWKYKKWKYTEQGWQKQITIVLKYPPPAICDRIDEAIASSWQGMNLSSMKVPVQEEKQKIHRFTI